MQTRHNRHHRDRTSDRFSAKYGSGFWSFKGGLFSWETRSKSLKFDSRTAVVRDLWPLRPAKLRPADFDKPARILQLFLQQLGIG